MNDYKLITPLSISELFKKYNLELKLYSGTGFINVELVIRGL